MENTQGKKSESAIEMLNRVLFEGMVNGVNQSTSRAQRFLKQDFDFAKKKFNRR